MQSHVISCSVKFGVAAAALCVLVLTPTARADDATPEQKAVKIRQSLFELIEWNFVPTIGEMLKKKMKYDPAVVQKSTARLEALAPMIPDAFALDTRKAGSQTAAREGIWNNMNDFRTKSDALVKALADLSVVAKGSDEKAFRAAAVAVGKACSGCHDSYKDS